MRAVVMTAAGGPDVLKIEEVPEPQVTGEHDVLVRLRAAGINPIDYKLRTYGTIGGELPAVLGLDGATYPLEQAAQAHRALEAGQVTGKAVLTMS